MSWTSLRPRVVLAALTLALNFAKAALLSGLDTARLIITGGKSVQGGLVRMPFGELPENSVNLLGAMITLTPGTTLVSIDTERREFVLHMLDLASRDQVFAGIRRDFCTPLQRLSEAGQ